MSGASSSSSRTLLLTTSASALWWPSSQSIIPSRADLRMEHGNKGGRSLVVQCVYKDRKLVLIQRVHKTV